VIVLVLSSSPSEGATLEQLRPSPLPKKKSEKILSRGRVTFPPPPRRLLGGCFSSFPPPPLRYPLERSDEKPPNPPHLTREGIFVPPGSTAQSRAPTLLPFPLCGKSVLQLPNNQSPLLLFFYQRRGKASKKALPFFPPPPPFETKKR